MATETDEFVVSDVTWNYNESREITSNRMRSPPVKGGLKSAAVSCKACGHAWTARRYGSGSFAPYIGGVLLTCPDCAADGKIELRRLR